MDYEIVKLKVQSRGPTKVSHTGQKTLLPFGEKYLEQTLKLVLHHHPVFLKQAQYHALELCLTDSKEQRNHFIYFYPLCYFSFV